MVVLVCRSWQWLSRLPLLKSFHVFRPPRPDGTLLQVDTPLLKISHDRSLITWLKHIPSDLSLLLRDKLHIWAAQRLPGSVILRAWATSRSEQGRYLFVGTYNCLWLQLAWQGTVRVREWLGFSKVLKSVLNNECSYCLHCLAATMAPQFYTLYSQIKFCEINILRIHFRE